MTRLAVVFSSRNGTTDAIFFNQAAESAAFLAGFARGAGDAALKTYHQLFHVGPLEFFNGQLLGGMKSRAWNDRRFRFRARFQHNMPGQDLRSEEHTSELQSHSFISYAV